MFQRLPLAACFSSIYSGHEEYRLYLTYSSNSTRNLIQAIIYIFFFIASLTRRKVNFIIHRSRWAHFRSLETTASVIWSLSQGFCELLSENEYIYHINVTHIYEREFSCGQSWWQIVAHIWTSKPVYSHLHPFSFVTMKSVSFAFQASEGGGCHCLWLRNIVVKHVREQVFGPQARNDRAKNPHGRERRPPATAWHVCSPEVPCYGLHFTEYPMTQDWVLGHSGASTASPSYHTD